MMKLTNLDLAKLVGDGHITLEEAEQMRDLRHMQYLADAVGYLRKHGVRPTDESIARTMEVLRKCP